MRGTYHLVPRNSGTSATPRYLIPSLQVQSQASGAEAAVTSVSRIIDIYTRHVDALQKSEGVPAGARITATVLTSPSAAEVQGNKMRGLAGTALLGAAGGIVGALWLDRYLLSRRTDAPGRRRRTEPVPVVS